MKCYLKLAGATVVAALTLPSVAAVAQVAQETVRPLGAPDKMETRIGTLEFKDALVQQLADRGQTDGLSNASLCL